MKTQTTITKATAMLLAGSVLLASCSSKTLIKSNPSGAKVYLNGASVGTTPYTHQDSKIAGTVTTIKLEKEGYEPLTGSFARNERADAGAIIGGIFLLVPFLWTMKYDPERTYDLVPVAGNQQQVAKDEPNTKSKADKLRELKQLLDEKLITQEEYDSQKKKILESEK